MIEEVGKLTIGKVAKLSNVGVETIRYYEREGLIKQPRKQDRSFREYSKEAVQRVRFIKRAQELGFSLSDISDLLSLRVDGRTSCATVKRKAVSKISQVEEKIADLERIRSALTKIKAHCERQSAGDKCPVLESFYA
jgi:Hg(II)-responsive transcriptional regulator